MITWKKSGRCLPSTCVEIAEVDGLWNYRQSDNPSAVIQYTTDQHQAITAEIRGDTPHGTSGLILWQADGGITLIEDPAPELDSHEVRISIIYTAAEVAAYKAALYDDDFQPVPTITPPEA